MLKAALPSLSPGMRVVAKYILDHPGDFGLDPIRGTAEKCGVSTYTLVRTAKAMGFDSFDALRAPFRTALVSASAVVDQPGWLDSLREDGPLGEVQAAASLNTMAIVQRSLETLSTAQMQRAVALLLEAPTVYLTGMRASYGLAYYLHYVGRMALPSLQLIPRHMGNAMDDLNAACAGDVMIAITFTPYSRETIEACLFARSKGVRLILITDSPVVAPEITAEVTLVCSVISTHHFASYVGAMATIETLLALLVQEGGAEARARITSYESLRSASKVYWSASKT